MSFPLKSLDCDFVVHVALNRGYRFGKKNNIKDSGIKPPTFYVFPIEVIEKARKEKRKKLNLQAFIDKLLCVVLIC